MDLTLRRHRLVAFLAAAGASLGLATTVAAPSGAAAGPGAVVDPGLRAVHGTVGVIVRGAHAAESAVTDLGGAVGRELPIIGGFSAKLPARNIDRLAHVAGVTSITYDRKTTVQAVTPQSQHGATNNLASVYKKVTRGDALNTIGGRGQGTTIALIDTGVTTAGLSDLNGQVVQVSTDPLGLTTNDCVNFTAEPTCADSYGHGTFMAGIMVGTGASSNGKYVGMAPAARVLSVKIAGADGSSDVSTIIAALQWVVSFRSQYNIRVLNLSLGTDSTQSYTVDPLDYAVERAWQSGIVVNVAASNRGPSAGTISDPANDPFVVTVGAVDDKATVGLNDDVVPDFSGRGPTASDGLAKPDVVAPGAHIVSLAAPGAAITTQFPSTMPAPYRRGSGTSMATAVVSGLEAQMLSVNGLLSPDRVKYMLTSTARRDASNDRMAVGSGVVDGYGALAAGPGLANVGVEGSTGTGSLAASRGTVGVVLNDANNTVLDASSGNLTSTLREWDPNTLLNDPWTGASWFAAQMTGASWFGASWFGDPSGASWFGASWFGASWFGGDPSGASWFGASWFGTPSSEDYGASWFGSAWYGAWDQ